MQGLRVQQDPAYHQLTITHIGTEEVLQTLYDTELGQFYHWLRFYNEPLDYIEVPFNEAYIEIIYVLKPKVLIVINKETVYQFLTRLFGKDALYCMEEVAATFVQGSDLGFSYDIKDFLVKFYNASTRGEALQVYNRWQELIPLNNEGLYKVLEIIEYYLDEILNYFDLRTKKREKVMG